MSPGRGALRRGDWKLVINGGRNDDATEAAQQGGKDLVELFNLADDPSEQTNLVVFSLLMVACMMFALSGALTLLHQYVTARIARRLHVDARMMLFQRFLFGGYDEVASRSRAIVLQDLNSPPGALHDSILRLGTLFTAIFNMAMMLLLMLYLSWWTTLLIGVVAMAGIIGTRRTVDRRSRATGRQLYDLESDQSLVTLDAIDGLKVVKVHSLETKIVERTRALLKSSAKLSMRLTFFKLMPAFLNEFVAASIAVLLGVITLLMPSVGMSFATLVAFLVAIRQCGTSTASINTIIVELQTWRRSIEVLEEVSRTILPEVGTRPVGDVSEIRLVGTSLQYPSREWALRDINLTLEKGKITAIVGSTGSGKSSIANLLVALYQPSSGSILVDGVPLRELNPQDWRRKIGYVPQDGFLFNASIRDNVTVWNEDLSGADIERAASLAQLPKFVKTLPQGYDTIVGDRGFQLSGGQRQIIAIARAVALRPAILIFDEATSALDNLTGSAVYEAMTALRRDAIVVVIAHRLSTVKDADQIVVVETGRIAELGTHQTLLLKKGLYSRLYETESVRVSPAVQ